jgi:hypothetical protein
MEPAFGVDFTGVRVHTGTEADALSRVLDARAFAIGKDVFFRDGEYNSENTGGRELLAHELTHVVQDSGVHCKLVVSAPDDETEQVAERVSKQVMRKPESESWTSTTDRREFKPNDFQSTCRKNNDGLHRYPKEEGLVVSGSIGSIEDYRKTKQVINDRIRTWTELGVGDLRDGIQEGVGSFERWHKARRKKPNAASFVMTLAQSLVGIIGVAVGAAVPGAIVPVVTALITGVTREARRCLAQEYNPNADPEEEVRKLAQNATSFSSWIDRYYDGWGAKLEEHAPAVWDEIQEYVVAEEIDQALEILHSQGGVPRMNEPYANDILNRLISDYLVWELKWNLDWERYTLPGMELSKQALEDIANEATLETRSQLRFREK